MRVLLFHPVRLPPLNYGGVERVVLWLAKGLVERGHEVFIAALAGSQLPSGCQLVETEEKRYTAEELNSLFPKNLDLVHFMAPLDPQVWNKLERPAVLTVHGNGQASEKFPQNTVFLSEDHALRHRAQFFIYNGIDPEDYRFNPTAKESWYLFLSKTSWSVKNLKGAMKYCHSAQVPLKIAGGNRPFIQRLQCAFSSAFTWEGSISGMKKAELLAHARALVFPILWPEPFGLVVIEALMSGTPVIASPRGSLRELVPSHVGALPQSDEEWVDILKQKFNTWEPECCRNWALEKFHYSQMAENYEQVYRRVMNGETLQPQAPVGMDWRSV